MFVVIVANNYEFACLLSSTSSPDLAKKTIIIQKSNGFYFMSEYASEFGCIREFVGEFASFLWQKDDG